MVQATHCLARTRFYGFMRTMKLKNKVRTTRKATSGKHSSCMWGAGGLYHISFSSRDDML